jgi:uncharacterized protein
MTMTVLWALPLGVAFGFALDRAGLTQKERIVGIFRFRDWSVLKFLLSGLIAGGLLVQGALALKLVASVPVPETRLVANLVGGAIFGIAMGSGGFCSGTILAAVGSRRRDVLPALLGLLAGGVLGELWHGPVAAVRALGPGSTTTVPDAWGVSAWYVLGLLLEVALLAFYAIERGSSGREHAAKPARSLVGGKEQQLVYSRAP